MSEPPGSDATRDPEPRVVATPEADRESEPQPEDVSAPKFVSNLASLTDLETDMKPEEPL